MSEELKKLRQRAERAEARVKELEAERQTERETAKTKAEDDSLRAGLRAAGVSEAMIPSAVTVLRGESSLLHFNESDGSVELATFGARTLRDAKALGAAFVERFPSFSAGHAAAVAKSSAPADLNNMSGKDLMRVGLERFKGKKRAERIDRAERIHQADGEPASTARGGAADMAEGLRRRGGV